MLIVYEVTPLIFVPFNDVEITFETARLLAEIDEGYVRTIMLFLGILIFEFKEIRELPTTWTKALLLVI